jgi:endonuclease/exonuclease/phosphatase (EEP) superfamily protein YafD
MRTAMRIVRMWLVAASWAYLTLLLGWLALYVLTGDRLWFVSLTTSLIQAAFWPLPVVVGLAVATRRRSLWVGSGAGLAAWLALFGGLFNFATPAAHAAGPTLRAMTYNVEYRNRDVDAIVATLREADADVVGIQELTPELAATLAPALAADYPYQTFNPREGVVGMGIASRYPFEVISPGDELGGFWIGEPQVVRVESPGGPLTLMNAHFTQGRNRDTNARRVATWMAHQTDPVVVVGDLNATDLSDAHATLTESGLRDTWREVGWGYGSTFPAANGIMPMARLPVFAPGRLVRIDFVFHSAGFTPLSAERLDWDGRSDHRAVVAELALTDG